MFQSMTFLPALGRILFAAIFIWAGINKLGAIDGTAGYIDSRLFAGSILVWLVIIFEIVGGLLLVVGFKVRILGLLFFAFCLLAAFIFHPFWTFPAEAQQGQWVNFMKNLALAGGACYFMYFGSGPMAVDKE